MAAEIFGVHGRLMVCGTCGEIKGPPPGRPAGIEQLCSCLPVEERRARPRWGGDIDRAVELCWCCGLVALPSGSRWSVLLCRPCLEQAQTLNTLCGRCVVPKGRHSLMNGVHFSNSAAGEPAAVVAFADQLQTFARHAADVESRAATVVLDNLASLGFSQDGDVLLDRYLDEAYHSDLSSSTAFRALLGSMLTAEDADRWAERCALGPGTEQVPPPDEQGLGHREGPT